MHPSYVLRVVVSLLAFNIVVSCSSRAIPQDKPEAPRDVARPFERDVVYSQPDGIALRLDVYLPHGKGPHPAILVVHGGAWKRGSKNHLSSYSRAFVRQGFAVFAINYRLAPRHKFPAQIQDCRSALLWIRAHATKYKIDPKRIGGIGYSAGGHLVSLLAATGELKNGKDTRLQAVVAGGAPCKFRDMPKTSQMLAFWLGGTRAQVPKKYQSASPTAFVTKSIPPMFFFHGQTDLVVPLHSPTTMVEAIKEFNLPVTMHVIENTGHILATRNSKALSAASKFFQKHLQSDEEQPRIRSPKQSD